MKPPFRYYGGKARIAPWIVSLMPPHRVYIEPFFGAGAVFFAKPKVRHELINDLDGMVVNFYRVLRDRPDDLVEALRLTPYARDEYNACKAGYEEETVDEVERARRFFATVSMSVAAVTGKADGFACSMKTGGSRQVATANKIDRLAGIAQRLRTVAIENVDARRLIETHGDSADCLIYCDPPYVHAARSGETSGYRHEMTDDDHRSLAEVLHATPATVLLSGYHSDIYDEMYDDWYRTETRAFSSTRSALEGAGVDHTRIEVLWSNRPFLDGRLLFDEAEVSS